AGGPVDKITRILAARLGDILGEQGIVEKVGGAGGMTGSNRGAKGEPNGYTTLMGGAAAPAQDQGPYQPPLEHAGSNFAPVSLVADSARVLITRKDLPVGTLPEFIAYAKANQAKLQYASSGAGSGMHICAVILNTAMGTTITHVPYRGAAPAMQDLLAGRIAFMCEPTSPAVPQIRAGAVKALVTLGPSRPPVLADLPTAAELGMPQLDCNAWAALVMPKGTPEAVIRKLAKATSEAIDSPAVRDRFEAVGV